MAKKVLPDIDPKPICRRLRGLREALGFSNASEFTRIIDINHQTYMHYEDFRLVKSEVLIRIKERFAQANIEWVLMGTGAPLLSSAGESQERSAGRETVRLLTRARIVLESETHYARSLESNIDSFYHGLQAERGAGCADCDADRATIKIREGDSPSKKEELLRLRAR